jgi:hypothetical protein
MEGRQAASIMKGSHERVMNGNERLHLRLCPPVNMAWLMLAVQVKPSLLHGDLWSGNISAVEGSQWAILDPATYYGVPTRPLLGIELPVFLCAPNLLFKMIRSKQSRCILSSDCPFRKIMPMSSHYPFTTLCDSMLLPCRSL